MRHRAKWPWWGMGLGGHGGGWGRGQWWGQVVVMGVGPGAGGRGGAGTGAGGHGGDGARWSWPGPHPQSGSDTLWPCHPGGSWVVRCEVKNTRQTLVLSKVKCVTRQPGGAENNPCLHSANSWLPWFPPPHFLASPRNPSVAARGPKPGHSPEDTQSHRRGLQGSLSTTPQGHRSEAWTRRWEDRSCAVWLQGSSSVSELEIDSR